MAALFFRSNRTWAAISMALAMGTGMGHLCFATAVSAKKTMPVAPVLTQAERTAYELAMATAAEQAQAMAEGRITSEALTRAYLARIAAIDDSGPKLNAVIALFPDALDQARTADEQRRAGTLLARCMAFRCC